jgi:SAM-dependent methyltransferase
MTQPHVPTSHAAARDYFDRTADDYAERAGARTSTLSSLIFQRRRETVLELLDESNVHGTLLDFGMGPGVLARDIADRGFDFIGVDISPEMVAHAEKLEVPRARFVVGDLDSLEPFRGSVDAVLAIGLIDYLERPAEGLRRLSDCLRPGGVLIVSFRNRMAVNTLLRHAAKSIWRRAFAGTRWRADSAFVAPVYEKAFTAGMLENELRRLGLGEFAVRYHSASPGFFASVPLRPGLWERWRRFDRVVSHRVPHVLCDAGVLRARRST